MNNNRIKAEYQEFKNYQYILERNNNKGKLRVPLSVCVQYKGFYGVAKVYVN